MNDIIHLSEQIISCRRCELCNSRKNAVPGEGSPDAKIMLIGEAPGRQEDETGRPFVGAAGRLLDKALKDSSISREEVFITNVVKCRPPNNRKPRGKEIDACREYLLKQIEIIKPKVIVTLGLTALQSFKKTSKLDLTPFEWSHKGLKVLIYPTYHPAAALRGNKSAAESLFRTFKSLGKNRN